MLTRRGLILGAAGAVIAAPAWAQGGYYGYKHDDAPEFHPNKDLADWFESLQRPDYDPATMGGIVSCCDAGDAYPIQIIEEATIGGKAEDGFAHVTDPSARTIVTPDGHMKYREEITGPLSFHFAGEKITREKNGNPTKTAWAFLRVHGGTIDLVYCVVPLPPSY